MIKIGCSLHDDCFTCPFSDCIAGQKRGKLNREQLKVEVSALHGKGYSSLEIAYQFNKSRRTIQRYLRERIKYADIRIPVH